MALAHHTVLLIIARGLLAGLLLTAVVLAVAALVRAIARPRATGGASGAAAARSAALLLVITIVLAAIALLGIANANVGRIRVALELSIIQSAHGFLHVFTVGELDHSLTVALDIGVHDVTNLAHEILQILPAAAAREVRHQHAILGSAATAARLFSSPSSAAVTLGEFHAQSVSIKIVTITATDSILRIPVVIKGDECERGRTSRSLQVDFTDPSIPAQPER